MQTAKEKKSLIKGGVINNGQIYGCFLQIMQKRRTEAVLKGRKMLQPEMRYREKKLRARTAWTEQKESL